MATGSNGSRNDQRRAARRAELMKYIADIKQADYPMYMVDTIVNGREYIYNGKFDITDIGEAVHDFDEKKKQETIYKHRSDEYSQRSALIQKYFNTDIYHELGKAFYTANTANLRRKLMTVYLKQFGLHELLKDAPDTRYKKDWESANQRMKTKDILQNEKDKRKKQSDRIKPAKRKRQQPQQQAKRVSKRRRKRETPIPGKSEAQRAVGSRQSKRAHSKKTRGKQKQGSPGGLKGGAQQREQGHDVNMGAPNAGLGQTEKMFTVGRTSPAANPPSQSNRSFLQPEAPKKANARVTGKRPVGSKQQQAEGNVNIERSDWKLTDYAILDANNLPTAVSFGQKIGASTFAANARTHAPKNSSGVSKTSSTNPFAPDGSGPSPHPAQAQQPAKQQATGVRKKRRREQREQQATRARKKLRVKLETTDPQTKRKQKQKTTDTRKSEPFNPEYKARSNVKQSLIGAPTPDFTHNQKFEKRGALAAYGSQPQHEQQVNPFTSDASKFREKVCKALNARPSNVVTSGNPK